MPLSSASCKLRFAHDLRRVMRYAAELKPGLIHVMSGAAQGPEARAAFVENLRHAADTAPSQGFSIEPLNVQDQPGYFLNDYALAVDILAEVDRPNVGLQYDTYHADVITGDALKVWEACGQHAVHIQIGDSPGRTTPGRGHIDFDAF